jgi:hypothetical protein
MNKGLVQQFDYLDKTGCFFNYMRIRLNARNKI